ncbi:MAG: adenylate/guanylate cyclase domain-containing protein [Bacteroidota bacterium]
MNRRVVQKFIERTSYGSLVGGIFMALNAGLTIAYVITGLLGGAMIGFLTVVLDRLLLKTGLRRQQFFVVLIIRSLAYLLVISLSLLLVASVYTAFDNNFTLEQLLTSHALKSWIRDGQFTYGVLYIFVLLLVLQFVTLVSRLLGPNVLLNYMVGRYHSPKEEERIFMFMDLRASTTIAERLGHLKWHFFLNDFFFDIAQPVRKHRGEIYQYVGDEVVISWPKEAGLRKINCVAAFFEIWEIIATKRAYYLETYGYEPVFKAGYHIGKVIAGEIGDFKRDIVFHGDTVNTASRIQMECNHYNRRLLMSDTLLKQLDLGDQYTSEYITKIKLRGKEQILELYSLNPVQELVNG